MHLYYSTCAAGLERVAADIARKTMPGFTQRELLSGAVIYMAKSIKPCAALQNTYLLIARYDRVESIGAAASRVAGDRRRLAEADALIRQHEFQSVRVMFSDGNTLSAVENSVRIAIERSIYAAKIDRTRPDAELLILRRTEGSAYLLLRLTKGNAEKKAVRGELSPSIALCMAHLVRPTPDGVFLDPFGGHGALLQARMVIGPVKSLYLFDSNAALVEAARSKFQKRSVTVERQDALSLDTKLERGCITEIATDPPWGLHEPLPMPPEQFYAHMLDQFAHALAPDGRLVLLTADKTHFERTLAAHSDFEANARYDILVNGKKAAVFTATRT